MEPFDLNTLVEYGFPNPDYFNFENGSLTYGNYGGQNYSAGEFTEPSRDPRRIRRR